MNVNLTPELERLVATKMKSGRCDSATEVLQEALRLLDERDEFLALRKTEIQAKIDEGWEAAGCGKLIDADEVFDRIDVELGNRERSAPK